jgi:hypothetical protein
MREKKEGKDKFGDHTRTGVENIVYRRGGEYQGF